MKKKLVIVFGIIFFAIFLERILSSVSLFENLELKTYDLRAKLATDDNFFGKSRRADKNIVIVAIDNESFKTLSKKNGKNWEKNVWLNVLNFIEKGHPKAVLFDMVFEKPEDKPWYDSSFGNALKKYDNSVLGTYLDNPVYEETNFTKKIEIGYNDSIPTLEPLEVLIDNKTLEKKLTYSTSSKMDSLYLDNNTIGVLNSVLDSDSTIRNARPIFKLVKDGKTYFMPSLAFAGFLKYVGEGEKILIKDNKIIYKNRIIPINDDGIVRISRHNIARGYSYIPISKILLNKGSNNDLKPEFFKDKMVIIGKPATGATLDLSSIIGSDFSTPESIAASLDNFVNDSIQGRKNQKGFISEVSKPTQFFITIVACLIVAMLGLIPQSAFIGFLNGFISIILYITFSFWMFVNPASRVLIPMAVPLYYIAVTSGLVFAFRFYKEMNRKNLIMNVFGKFVSPKVLSVVLKSPEKMVLKNSRKKITILFCDVKNFSTICEQNDPEKLIGNLNELFKEIVNIIFENKGTVDKFIGDCIMAYWGDFVSSEEDSYLAVKTALEIKAKVEELKRKNLKENKIPFDVKIGINTGEAVLGLAGTDKIMSYTAMGDAVNIASRLESSCSTLGHYILISKSTYDEVSNKIEVLPIGEIEVKGKTQRIQVFEPTSFIENSKDKQTEDSIN